MEKMNFHAKIKKANKIEIQQTTAAIKERTKKRTSLKLCVYYNIRRRMSELKGNTLDNGVALMDSLKA